MKYNFDEYAIPDETLNCNEDIFKEEPDIDVNGEREYDATVYIEEVIGYETYGGEPLHIQK